MPLFFFHSCIVTFAYICFKQFQYLLHNFYIAFVMAFCVMSLSFFAALLSNCSNCHTSDCFKLGNVHSLQIAMNKLYIKIKKLFLLISVSFYITGTIFTVEIISKSLWCELLAQNCVSKQFFLLLFKKKTKTGKLTVMQEDLFFFLGGRAIFV